MKIAIGWAAWQLSHSAFWTAVVAAAYLLPAFLLCPLFGVLADQIRLKRGMLLATGSLLVVGLVMALGVALDWLSVLGLALLSLVHGTIAALYHPMRLTIIGRLVERAQIPSASGYSSIAFNTSRALGPAIAGALLGWRGTVETLLLGSLLYVPFLLMFPAVVLRERQQQASGARWSSEMLAGLRYARQFTLLLPVLLMSAINGVIGRALFEMLPAIVGGSLNRGADGLAWLTAAAGVGAVGAALVMARVDAQSATRLYLLALSVAATCVTTVLVGIAPAWLLAMAACLAVGFTASFAGITSQSILQITLADEFRGRIMSLWTSVSFGAPAAGALAMGVLAKPLGLASAITWTATVGLIFCVLLAWWQRELPAAVR